MTSNLNQGSARIYQFPTGGRAALGERRHAEAQPALQQDSPRLNETACSSSWYHEAAIQESKPAWER